MVFFDILCDLKPDPSSKDELDRFLFSTQVERTEITKRLQAVGYDITSRTLREWEKNGVISKPDKIKALTKGRRCIYTWDHLLEAATAYILSNSKLRATHEKMRMMREGAGLYYTRNHECSAEELPLDLCLYPMWLVWSVVKNRLAGFLFEEQAKKDIKKLLERIQLELPNALRAYQANGGQKTAETLKCLASSADLLHCLYALDDWTAPLRVMDSLAEYRDRQKLA